MNIITTSAPIPMDLLKQYFSNKDTVFHIDYDSSELKGQRLLTYLGNLELPCDVIFANNDQLHELTTEYLKVTQLVTVPILEKFVIALLLQRKGLVDSGIDSTIVENLSDQLDLWIKKLESMSLFNMTIIPSNEIKDWVAQFPTDDSTSLEGINFLNMFNHEEFFTFYEKLDHSNLTNYTKYFNEYMFKGQNLYYYWAKDSNPMFLLTAGIASNAVNSTEYKKAIDALEA